MKRLLILICFLHGSVFLNAQSTQTSKVNWLADFEEAKFLAKNKKVQILLYFTGSDWCRPCHKLQKEVFGTKSFGAFANSYALLKIDIPRNRSQLTPMRLKQNFNILNQYNTEKSFPLILVLDENGKEIDKKSGYSSQKDAEGYIDFLKKHSS